jgi:hypothetical protein
LSLWTFGDRSYNFQWLEWPLRSWRVSRRVHEDRTTAYEVGPLVITCWRASDHPVLATHSAPSGADKRLQEAITSSDSEDIRRALLEGGDPNSVDEQGVPVLMRALSRPDRVTILLEAGADPNSLIEDSGITALMWASLGPLDTVLLLLEAGADPNAREMDSAGTTAIHWAFSARKVDHTIVEALLQYGADVNARNVYGETPILVAVKRRIKPVVPILMHAGADPGIDSAYSGNAWWLAHKWNRRWFRRAILKDSYEGRHG